MHAAPANDWKKQNRTKEVMKTMKQKFLAAYCGRDGLAAVTSANICITTPMEETP